MYKFLWIGETSIRRKKEESCTVKKAKDKEFKALLLKSKKKKAFGNVKSIKAVSSK
jgi:hypothetical protein